MAFFKNMPSMSYDSRGIFPESAPQGPPAEPTLNEAMPRRSASLG